MTGVQTHGGRPMAGRDPHEPHRASSPLELLFDLTIVVAFSVAGSNLAHALVERHVATGLAAFGFAMFAVCWAWINFSWFASAFDNDDWFMRLATLTQMVGVLVLALGLNTMFASLVDGDFDNTVMVAGYVTMRASMIVLWLRAARHNPALRRTCLAYARLLAVAQAGWIVVATDLLTDGAQVALAAVLILLETGGVVRIESRLPSTPWHPHHIAERYSLLVIIALGEVVLGTTIAIEAVVSEQGWSAEAVAVAAAGVSLAFGLLWGYFAIPFGDALVRHRGRSFAFGYGHVVLYAAIAAIGAGLHATASYVEGASRLDEAASILTVAVPVAAFTLVLVALFHLVLPGKDPLHWLLGGLTLATLGAAWALAAAGAPLGWCVVVMMLAPWVLVVGYEVRGHRHVSDRLTAS